MNQTKIVFIGGGNMASALIAGLAGKRVAAADIHVIDPNAAALKLCETLVDLRLTHSRAGLYHARPREAAVV